MDCCRVVGPRGLCRPLDEKQGLPTNTSPLAPCLGCSKAEQSRTTFREEAGGLLPRRIWAGASILEGIGGWGGGGGFLFLEIRGVAASGFRMR